MSFQRFLKPKRLISVVLACSFIVFFYYLFGSTISKQTPKIDCKPDSEIHSNLLKLASVVTEILTKENITHFLCYGTLWGALRHGNILPWKRDFDICLVNSELLSRMDEGYLRRLFRFRGVDMEYSNAMGVYTAWMEKKTREKGILNLFVFEKFENQMRRIGLRNRLIPIPVAGEAADTFPIQLVARPLNTIKVKNLTLPAPREGAEIQKYHYKDNWWMEVKPEECS